MNTFMDENFLLHTETAKHLFFDIAQRQPIFDYHCHLSPKAIAEDVPFTDIASMWLEGDHYKWRIMRANGVPEELCAGNGPWDLKFEAYARALTRAAGNPLLHWSHLELQRVFGIQDILKPENARQIRERANRVLAEHRTSPRSILTRFNVRVLCTTDDPADDLCWHRKIAEEQTRGSSFSTKVLPAFRPDKAMNAADIEAWNRYMNTLGAAAGLDISNWGSLKEALIRRHSYFHEMGCRLSDHALLIPPYAPALDETLETVVAKARIGASLSPHEQEQLATAVLQLVAELNMRYGWTMQLHIGALRNVNHRLYAAFGPDVGGDTISDASIVAPLAAFLGMLEERNSLPNTILYTLDPTKHTALAALAGSFCGTGSDGSGTAALHAPESTAARSAVPGKVQLGAAWWFNDQKDGMERHMREYASVGLLGSWVGMLTDSRSFLSFPRHEYFRRILCDIVGGWVEAGELPNDAEYTESLVRGICFENAASYFGIPVAT